MSAFLRLVSRSAFAVAFVLAVILTACSSEDDAPQSHTLDLVLRGGAVAEGDLPWRVNAGDTVTMTVTTDEPVTFHLHGYDIEHAAAPGEPAQFTFTADASGSFPVTLHRLAGSGEDHGGMAMAASDHANSATAEAPAGMAVTLTATPDAVSGVNLRIAVENFTFAPLEVNGAHVPGHGHAHAYVDSVKVARVYGPYAHIDAEPGMREIGVALNANNHAPYTIDGMPVADTVTVHVPGGEGGAAAEADELELGRLEVLP